MTEDVFTVSNRSGCRLTSPDRLRYEEEKTNKMKEMDQSQIKEIKNSCSESMGKLILLTDEMLKCGCYQRFIF